MAKKQAAQAPLTGVGKTTIVQEISPVVNVGENVRVGMEGSELVIRIDAMYRGGLSASGKTTRVASTLGNVKLPCGITLGLNAYVK